MAFSYEYYKEDIKNYLIERFKGNAKVLDVGAGEGIYWKLLHRYFKVIDAVEVYNIDIKDFKYSNYDIIIFGDIIEHLDIKEAQEVLKYAYDHCKEMIVAVPYELEQGIVEDNIYEIHKQPDLTPVNVLERYPMLKELYKNDLYGYYIKGE